MSTIPSVPNPADAVPVAASTANSRVPLRNITRAAVPASPRQYPTPRCEAAGTGGPPPRRPPPAGASPGGGAAAAGACASLTGGGGAAGAAGTVKAQTSFPVSASSATTRGPLDANITPSTTNGTDVAPPPSRYVHACFSDATLLVLICVRGEKRVAARSR